VVPAYLNVVDIAGLVKGAAEGQGLGNDFLSHISACDAIFHLCRAFEDPDVTHVEGEVDPVRDLEIISPRRTSPSAPSSRMRISIPQPLHMSPDIHIAGQLPGQAAGGGNFLDHCNHRVEYNFYARRCDAAMASRSSRRRF